jgi:hypothetical protein
LWATLIATAPTAFKIETLLLGYSSVLTGDELELALLNELGENDRETRDGLVI